MPWSVRALQAGKHVLCEKPLTRRPPEAEEAFAAAERAGCVLGRRHHLEAIGEDGSLFLGDPWHGVTPAIELRRDDGTETIEIAPANPYSHELIGFARAVRGEAPPLLGAADALAQARVIAALYASAADSTTKGLT